MRRPTAWMRRVAAACLLCFAPALAQLALPVLAIADDSLPEPIAWRQNAFSIPFKVAAGTTADQKPSEIRLYVSTDQGTKWDLAQKVPSSATSFTFKAPADGEYWFLIRSVDRKGQVQPDLGAKPELRVIVDTAAPRLEISATRGEAGQIRATWQAVDPLLNADSLKIEYQTTDGKWRPIAIDRPPGGNQRSTTSGTMTWWPADAPSTVKIRAEVSDRAGNVAVSQAAVEGVATAPHSDLAAGDSSAKPKASTPQASPVPPLLSGSSPNSAAVQPWSTAAPSASKTSRPTTGMALPSPALPGSLPSGNTAPSPGNAPGSPWPADHVASDPFGRAPINTAMLPDGPMESTVSPPIRNQASASDNFSSPPPSAIANPSRSASESFPGNPTVEPPSSSPNTGLLPPGERPRMVNSRSFDLDYEVDGVGPYGIAKVELWGTRDGGRTWSSYGVDNDNRSPIRASVDGEGLYGFRISVQSGNGLGGQPPRSGESPQMWVSVDLTKPMVRLTGAEPGAGEHAGELMIRWEATDASLASRPITLQFSDKPSGPWSIIAAGLENSGSYSWRPDNRAPDRIYLRIEARDEAGNTATYDTTEPTPLDRVRPEGHIREVRPAADSAFHAWIDGGTVGR